MKKRIRFGDLIHIAAPPIIYMIFQEICGIALTVAAIWKGFHGMSGVFSLEGMSLAATAAAAIISIPIFWIMKDRDETRFPSDYRYEKTRTWRLIYVVPLGFFAAAAFNRIMTILQLDKLFPGYEDTAEILYSAGFPVELIILGIIVPIAEELIFRGVVYGRMLRFMSVKGAVFWSSLFFGIWHGNVSQGIYAFLLGILMSYVLERYKTILAPVLFHMFANMFAVFIMEIEAFNEIMSVPKLFPAFLVLEIAVSVLLFWRIEEDVEPKMIKKNREWHRDEKEPVDRF